jgi:hypothetical protein
VSVLRPHVEPQGLGLWSSLVQASYRFTALWRARCEAIVDAMFGFELRREEQDHLTRRKR